MLLAKLQSIKFFDERKMLTVDYPTIPDEPFLEEQNVLQID